MKYATTHRQMKSFVSLLLVIMMVMSMGLEPLAHADTIVYSNEVTVGDSGNESPLSAMEQLLADNGGRAYVSISKNDTKVYDSSTLEKEYGKVGKGYALATGYFLSLKDTPNVGISFVDEDGNLRSAYIPVSRVSIPSESQQAIADGLMANATHFADAEREVPLPIIAFTKTGADDEIIVTEAAQLVIDMINALPETISITPEDIAPLYEAWLAYHALSEEERAMVENAEKLESLWAFMRSSLPAAVILAVDAIDALPSAIVTQADQDALQEVFDLLMALSEEEFALVYNISKLWALGGGIQTLDMGLGISYPVRLVWDDDGNASGSRPETVTLTLYANGVPYAGEGGIVEVDTAQETYEWTDLPEDDGVNPYVYSVKQSTARGYRTTYAYDDVNGEMVVTNQRLEGSLTLKPMDGSNFRIRYTGTSDVLSVIAKYSTYLANEKQTLRIILPPYFELAAPPSNGTGYKVSTQTVPLPAEYYPGADAALLKAEPAARTNCKQITIAFDETVSGTFTLTFGINIAPSTSTSSTTQYLSELMVKYGANPDKIPLNIIAIVEDANGVLLDDAVYHGTSAITTADGSAAFESTVTFPRSSAQSALSTTLGDNYYSRTTAGYYYNTVALGAYYSPTGALAALTNWHYPYTKMYLYFPLPEGVTVGYIMGQGAAPGAKTNNFWLEGEAEVNGKRYAKIGVNDNYVLNIYNGPYIPNARVAPNYFYDALTYIFPDMDTLLPGDVFEMGDVYIDYCHKGEDYEKVKIWSLSDYTVPTYTQSNFTYAFLANSGNFENTAVWQERLQGQKADQYKVSWSNQSNSNLTYMYEDASVCVEFPYEVAPTSVTCTGVHYMSQSSYTGMGTGTQTTYPKSASYWVYGDNTEYTIPMTGSSVSFPDVHISKIALNYDTIFSASQYTYTFVANNGKVDVNGKELGERYQVQLRASLLTKSGKRLKAAEDPNKRVEEEYTLSNNQTFYLIQYPDALLFGTYYTSSYKTRTVLCYNRTNSYGYNGSYYWRFSFTKSKSQMKDYEDVKITIKPQDTESNKAMSKISGFYVDSGYLTFASRILINYKTNKSGGAYKTYAVTNYGSNYLPLDSDEYVVDEVVFDLGKIDGSKMTATSSANITLTSDYWNHSSTQHSIYPLLNEFRYYYAGNSAVVNEYPVSSTDSHTLVATVSTSSAAKYITGEGITGTEKSNKTSTGTVKYLTQWTAYMYKTATNSASNWNNTSKVYYRGDTIKVNLEFASLYTDSMTWAGGTYYHNYDDLLLYLEVQNGFALSSLAGYELQEVRQLENGNSLYVYRFPSARVAASSSVVGTVAATIVVLPDAPIGIRTIIPNAGYCLDGFVRDYMTPTDTYYLNEPYYKYVLPTNGNFAAHWNIPAASAPEGTDDPYGYAKYQVKFGYSTNTDVTIQIANVDRIAILPGVAGAIQANPAEFYDYQKGNLLAHAWMANNSESEIAKYEAVFQLPRKGQTTTGYSDGKITASMNAFSLYLKGPVTFGNSKPEEGKYRIVYYRGAEAFTPLSAADWKSVTEVHVFFDKFPALRTFDCVFNLETDDVKVGNQTADIFAYLGAGRRYILSEDLGGKLEDQTFLYSTPAEYAFKSLWLKVRVGEDRNETGAFYTNLSGYAEITIYYEDQTQKEQVLYKSSTGNLHNVPVNADVTRVTARIMDNYQSAWVIAGQNMLGVAESQDSDFPRVLPNEVSSLDIDVMDLVGTTTAGNKYDVNLTRRPTVTAADLYLRPGQSLPAVITLGYSGNPTAKYKVTYEVVGPNGIATIAANGVATGVAKGETTYRVTVTNTLGTLSCDTVTAEAKIYVVDDFRVAMRAFWDSNYNGVYDEGEEIVTFSDIAVAQEYFWLATSNSVSTAYKLPSREPAYDSATGYFSFQVPTLAQYYAIARNPAGTAITDENAARSGTLKPVIKGATAGYVSFTGSSQSYGSVTYNFATKSYDEDNLLLTTYIDFPIEKPHTVTFRAVNGTIIAGTSPTSNMILVNGSSVQTDMATGATFTQKRFWHNTTLSYIYQAAQVTPDEGYVWTTTNSSPYYNMRNWKRTDNGSGALKPEYSGWYSQTVTEDMTLVAVPSKLTLHARIFYDENRNGAWDEGEEIIKNPTIYLLHPSYSYTTTTTGLYYPLTQEENSTYSSAVIPNIDMSLWAYYGGGTGANDYLRPDAMRFTTAAVSLSGQAAEIKTMSPASTSVYSYASMRMDYTAYTDAGDVYVDVALQRPYTVIFKAENGEVVGGNGTSTYTSHIVNYATDKGVQTDTLGNKFIETKWWPNSALASMAYYAQVTPASQYTWSTNTSVRQWRREEGATTAVNTEYVLNSLTINADMTLVALPTRSKYNVTYVLGGGVNHASNPSEYSITGTFPVVINAPTKKGYDFQGWTVDYDNENYTDITTPTKTFSIVSGTTGDIELTAHWKVTDYTITYAGLSGSGVTLPSPQPSSYNVETPAKDRVVGEPSRKGYTFKGWTVDYDQAATTLPDASAVFDYSVPTDAMGNITLTAVWEAIEYNIVYELDGGTNAPSNPGSYTADDLALPISNPTKVGYDFIGWTVVYADGTAPVDMKTTSYSIPKDTTETVTLTAHWNAVVYNITYANLSGVAAENPAPMPMTYTVLELSKAVGAPTWKGYTFKGWTVDYTNGSLTDITVADPAYAAIPLGTTGDVKLTAVWTENQYAIHYDGLDGATNPSPMPTTIKVTDAAKPVGDPKKSGYVFQGWTVAFDDEDQTAVGSPAKNYTIPAGVAGDVWLTAKWRLEDDYQIHYAGLNLPGVTLPSPQPSSYNVETPATDRLVGDPSRLGYTFEGWTVDYTSGLVDVTGQMNYSVPMNATGDITLTAVWKPVVYDIAYEMDGGTNAASNPDTYTVEDLALTIANPTKPGYDFAGWTAMYEDGTDAVTVPSTSYAIPENTTGTVTLTAHWEATDYNITYAGLSETGVTLPSPQPDTYNVETPAEDRIVGDPDRLGYTFEGWTVDYTDASGLADVTGQEDYSIPTNATGDITLTAVWKPIVYDIAYEMDGGTNPASNPATYTVEDLALTIANPSKTGYNFTGWTAVYKDGTDAVTVPTTSYAIPERTTETVTLTAHWEIIEYSITYAGLSGTDVTLPSPQPSSYNVKTLATDRVVGDPSRKGYTFQGWTVDYTVDSGLADATGQKDYSVPMNATGDITLTAVWTENQYTIYYDGLTGAINPNPMPTTIKVTDAAKPVGDPTKTGYVFQGWTVAFDDGDQTDVISPEKNYTIPAGVAGDVYLTAKWALANDYQIYYAGLSGTGVTLPSPQPSSYNVETLATDRVVGDPSRKGYTFEGWNVDYTDASGLADATGQKNYGVPMNATGDITLTAVWKPIVYDIVYVMDGGTNAASNPNTYTVEYLALTINAPTREHYGFTGWTVVYADGTAPITTPMTGYSIPVGTTGTVTLTAHWSEVAYPIEYVGLTGTPADDPSPKPVTYTVESYPTVGAPKKTGYDFLGWTVVYADGTPNVTTPTLAYAAIPNGVTGKVQLTANWTPIVYDIAYNGLTGATDPSPKPTEYTIEQTQGTPSVQVGSPSKVGYEFTGWTVVYDNASIPDVNTPVLDYSVPANATGKITLTATWKALGYVVNYVMNGGVNAPTNPTTYRVTDSLPIPIVSPTKSGYTFEGWTVDYANSAMTDITVPVTSYSIPYGATGDITLTASWQMETYIITYSGILEANPFSPKPETYNVEMSFPISVANPTRDGYTFLGWTVDYANGKLTDINTPKVNYAVPAGTTGNIALTAMWKQNPVGYTPVVTKTVAGDDASTVTFTFELTRDVNSYPMPAGVNGNTQTVNRKGPGDVVFGRLVFDKAGTYTYTLKEKDLKQKWMTYDSQAITLTVVVVDNGGVLEASATYAKNGRTAPDPAFNNSYKIERGWLQVTKTVTGTGGDTAQAFPFRVTLYPAWSGLSAMDGNGQSIQVKSGDTVYLRHGQTFTIFNVPEDTSYTVSEINSYGHTVSSTGSSGTIQKNATATAAFTNRREATVQFTLTINYWYDAIGGSVAAPTYTKAYASGTTYGVQSPHIPGWSPDQPKVSGKLTADTSVDVVYKKQSYTLTIHYMYTDGRTASPTRTLNNLSYGDPYDVASPAVTGFHASVERVAGTMPARNLEFTVIYSSRKRGDGLVNLLDDNVPLGLGTVVMNVGDIIE